MRILFLLGLMLFSFCCFGQQFSFSIMPHYSYGATLPPHYKLLAGTSFISPKMKTHYEGNLTNSNGTTTTYKLNNIGFGLSTVFKITNGGNGNAWAILIGGNRQNHILFFNSPPFYSPAGSLSGYYENFRTINLSAGLRKEFTFKDDGELAWFVQLGAMYNLQTQTSHYVSGGWQNFAPESTPYSQNGAGALLTYSSAPSKALVIVPEVGVLSKGKIGLEISISYQQPIVSSLYVLNASYYQGGKISGTQEANITQQSVWINAKLPITLYTHIKRQRTHKNDESPKYDIPNPSVSTLPKPVPPSVVVNGQAMKKGESIALNSIQFEQSKSELLTEGKAELDNIIELMDKYPTLVIELSGHTSSEGNETENIKLSKKRVAVCKDYIATKVANVNNRVRTIGYGSSKPRVPNTSDENRKKNRRVELKVESL